MAETLQVDLVLVDRVSEAAKASAAALRLVDTAATKAQAAANKSQDAQAKALRSLGLAQIAAQKMDAARGASAEKAASKAAAIQSRLARLRSAALAKEEAATRKLGLAQLQAAKMNEAFDKKKKGNTFFGGFGEKLGFRSVADYAKGAFVGELAASAAKGILGGFVSGAKAAVGFVADGIHRAFEAGGRAESQRLGYRLSLGAKGGAAFEADTQRMAGLTPFNENQIGSIMTMLNQAGLKDRAGRTAFATAGDIAAGQGRGADEHAVMEIANQLSRIKLGGTIDKQHLLALGLDFKAFYASLGKQLHMSAEAVQKSASEGKLDPQLLLNEVTAQQNKKQGGIAGTGMSQAAKTMEARLNRLGELPELYLAKMSTSPSWMKLSNKLGDVLAGLSPDSPRGKKIIDALFGTFNKLADWIARTLTPANVDAFTAGVAGAVAMLTKIPAILNAVVTASEVLAAIWTGKKIVDAITGSIVAVTALSVPVLAVVAALTAAAAAVVRIYDTVQELGGIKAVGNDFLDFVANPMGVPAAAGGGAISDADFDAKYGGAGYKLKPAGGGKAVNVEFSGDINVTPQPGESTEDAVSGAYAGAQQSMQSIAERAASEGG